MKRCPKCNTEVDEVARFCPACGARLGTEVVDAAWIAGMQEEIKEARHLMYGFGGVMVFTTICACIPWILAACLSVDSSGWTWITVLLGVVVGIVSIIFIVYNGRRVDRLTRELKEGKRDRT